MKLNDSVRYLKGVGPKKEKYLKSIGINSIKDLLLYFPRAYEDQSNIKPIRSLVAEEKQTSLVKFVEILEDRQIRRNLRITKFLVEDSSSSAIVSFFNNRFIKDTIRLNELYVISGKVSIFNNAIQFTSPDFIEYKKYIGQRHIYPIYNLSKNISNKDISKMIDQVIDKNLFEESLSKEIIDKYKLMDKNESILNIHRPADRKAYIRAKQRLCFEEFLYFNLNLLLIKNKNKNAEAYKINFDKKINDFIKSLDFELTEGQKNVLNEIFADLTSGKKMNRLIQGDVGSGKTIIAIIAMYLCYLNGYQSSIMAPTEVLAKQHLNSFRQMLEKLGVKVELLVGSTSKKNRDRILNSVEIGEVDILIGTHALLNEEVKFKKLGLNVTDEQHRFGVMQRESFNTKAKNAHSLVMTATPIPRTLSLVLFNDLDISIIDTMPLNRKKITTMAINKLSLNRGLDFIKKEIDKGRQAYIITPLIEENSDLDLNSAIETFESLRNNTFKNYKLALLHGRMTNQEKDEIMRDFEEGKIDILVSTTVIEVGINVKNASVILVYDAQRFGLAQLHQLRGRVGRGEHKSYCILYNSSNTDLSWERMKVLEDSNDGFYIADKDLELRGSGNVFGKEQSGFLDFKIADITKDLAIFKHAQIEAEKILEEDPDLTKAKNLGLKDKINQIYNESSPKILN